MTELDSFEVNGAIAALGQTFGELSDIVEGVRRATHQGFVHAFQKAGWSTEVPLLGKYRVDAFKDGVVVEVESVDRSGVIDTLHRDFFRLLILFKMGKATAAVIITRSPGAR